MKKILIMIMSCNQEHFLKQEQTCKETYLKDLPDNIDYLIYRGGEKTDYTEDNHVLIVDSRDDLKNTYTKTYKAFQWVDKNIKYDYIFRTNTSTYINIDLLNYFIQHTDIDENIWTSEVFCDLREISGYKWVYGRGNGLILSPQHIDIILEHGLSLACMVHCIIDDMGIGCVINTYRYQQGQTYYNYIKGYKEAWYKAIQKPGYYPTSISNFNNTNIDFDYLKQFITIQIRNYYDRTQENDNFKLIDNVFKNNKDKDIENTYKEIIEYSKNPDVFLGDTYGYRLFNDIFKTEKDNA